jgi:hypothetical protein
MESPFSMACKDYLEPSSISRSPRYWWSTRKPDNHLHIFSLRASCCLVSFCLRTDILHNRTCAIVGGVLTVTSLLDGALFAATRSLKKGGVSSSNAGGKLM